MAQVHDKAEERATVGPPASGLALRFSTAIFTSALLMFLVEPLVAKMLLPLLGGAPAVWTTCMLFFQAILLAGYAYAHVTTRWLGPRRQSIAHLGLVAASFVVLPLAIDERAIAAWPAAENPAPRLLWLLLLRLGAPFLVLAATSPLLQRWFSAARDERARDPYFLYVASNLGSMLALIAYPLVVERALGLAAQRRAWTWGYALFAALVVVAAAAPLRSPAREAPIEAAASPRAIGWPRRFRWFLLAAVPSSQLLGVTTYVTTDVAGVPLFWIAPLAIYLLTFIFVFARRPPLSHPTVIRYLPLTATLAMLTLVAQVGRPALVLVAIHLAALFFAAMACHGELARDRPAAADLTDFYLSLSIGGVLGGLVNALLAPALLDSLAEYPLAIVATFAAIPAEGPTSRRGRAADLLVPIGVSLLGAALIVFGLGRGLPVDGRAFAALIGAPFLINYVTRRRPRRFGLGLAGLALAGTLFPGVVGRTIFRERGFFGLVRVSIDPTGRFRQVAHGNTVHGRQSLDPAHAKEPTGYYAASGPLGDVFAMHAATSANERVGVIGLGTGGMAAYARRGERWTFFEINPVMVRVARDPRFFTYLADAFPHDEGLTIELGDARLRLHDAPDGSFGLLVLDAFNSDSIPAHLLTREALRLYLQKLAPGGALVFHLSNDYLDLVPVVSDLAADAGLVLYVRDDTTLTRADVAAGKLASRWAVLARDEADLRALPRSERGFRRTRTARRAPWTDDDTNVVGALVP